MTTFLFIILFSKLVLCCAVFCGNGEGKIGGRYSVFFRGVVCSYWIV